MVANGWRGFRIKWEIMKQEGSQWGRYLFTKRDDLHEIIREKIYDKIFLENKQNLLQKSDTIKT